MVFHLLLGSGISAISKSSLQLKPCSLDSFYRGGAFIRAALLKDFRVERISNYIKEVWRLFLTGCWPGSTVFGGLQGAYSLLREKSVRLNWAREEEVDGMYALSFFLPGLPYLNFWGVLASRIAGTFAAFIANFGLMLPTLLLVLVLPSLQKIPFVDVHKVTFGIGAMWATSGLMIAVGYDGLMKLKSNLLRSIFLLSVVLLFLKISILLLVFGGLCLGVLFLGGKAPIEKK